MIFYLCNCQQFYLCVLYLMQRVWAWLNKYVRSNGLKSFYWIALAIIGNKKFKQYFCLCHWLYLISVSVYGWRSERERKKMKMCDLQWVRRCVKERQGGINGHRQCWMGTIKNRRESGCASLYDVYIKEREREIGLVKKKERMCISWMSVYSMCILESTAVGGSVG